MGGVAGPKTAKTGKLCFASGWGAGPKTAKAGKLCFVTRMGCRFQNSKGWKALFCNVDGVRVSKQPPTGTGLQKPTPHDLLEAAQKTQGLYRASRDLPLALEFLDQPLCRKPYARKPHFCMPGLIMMSCENSRPRCVSDLAQGLAIGAFQLVTHAVFDHVRARSDAGDPCAGPTF